MKFEDVKIGMKVVCSKYMSSPIRVGGGGTVVSIRISDNMVEVCWDSTLSSACGQEWWVDPEYIEAAAKPFPLTNTKINVHKYAEDNGLTFAAADKEVQEWLFGQGYKWVGANQQEVACSCGYIFLDSHVKGDITQTFYEDSFNNHRNKEITLQHTAAVTLTPSFVEPAAAPVEYVELGGKRYVKADLEEALSKIKAVED